MGLKGVVVTAISGIAKSFAGMSRTDLDQELAKIAEQREEIQSRQLAANRRLDDATKNHAAAVAEHARLETACAKKEEDARPYAELGKAVGAVKAFHAEVETAETTARNIATVVRDELQKLNQREMDVRRNTALADFRGAVLKYERAIQAAGLAHLSKEVRRLADVAGVRLENHSPLLDEDYTLIGGYNLNIHGHSNTEGQRPLATNEEK